MCFSLPWAIYLLITLVAVGIVIALLKLFLPYILSLFGVASELVMRAVNIIIGGLIVIWFLYFLLDLATCMGAGRLR